MWEILREIGMIYRALDSISNMEFKEYDLTKGQYMYLVRVCESPGLIQEELSSLLNVDRTTVSRAVNKLENKGLIVKKNDEHNKKIKRLYPTEKGKEIYPFIIREHEHSNRVALKGLSESEIKTLYHLLQRIRENVSADWDYVKKGNKRKY